MAIKAGRTRAKSKVTKSATRAGTKAKSAASGKQSGKPASKKTLPAAKVAAKGNRAASAGHVSHGFDFAAFGCKVERAARTAFAELVNANPSQQMCAFALYSDDGAMTVCPSTNTKAHLERKVAQAPKEADYFTFAPAEWALEAQGARQEFGALCAELLNHVRTLSDDAFELFQSDLAETCVAALERLRHESYFEGVAKGPVVLLFQASVGDADAKVERRMIQRLNDGPVVKQHHRWTESWGK